jgi:hypothetical protein
LVEDVDRNLCDYARALIRLSEAKVVAASFANVPPGRVVVRAKVVVGTGSAGIQEREYAPVDVVRREKELVQSIADRDWKDLVCDEDFFLPRGGTDGDPNWRSFKVTKGRKGNTRKTVTDGAFVHELNPELPPIGDNVRHCLFRRIEIHSNALVRFQARCQRATGGPSGEKSKVSDVEKTSSKLRLSIEKLHAALDVGEHNRLRESCTVLAQVYVAFAPNPDVGWLGLPDHVVAEGRVWVGGRAQVVKTSDFYDRIVVALRDLSTLYAGTRSEQSERDKAIADGGLVLTDEPGAFWEGHRLDVDWSKHRVPWILLWRLAGKARTGQVVVSTDVYDDVPGSSTMARNVHSLKRLLKGTLIGHIKPGAIGRETYRLNLSPDRITLFGRGPSTRRLR